MRFQLTLQPLQRDTYVPFNYQYPLSAVIYKKLALASEGYADFLHREGYTSALHSKHFKLFCFSNLEGSLANERNALRLKGNELSFKLACHMPEFADNLIKGIFLDQQITLGGSGAKASFTVKQVSVISSALDPDTIHTVTLKPLSPVVAGERNERSYYNYLSPLDSNFIPLLKNNLKDKFLAIGGTEEEFAGLPLEISLNLFPDKLKSRLVTIKENTPEESKVRGFVGFEILMKGSGRLINLLMDSGVLMQNSQGFGCLEII